MQKRLQWQRQKQNSWRRYEKEACQGKRNDILEEIARLEGKEISITRGHDDHRLKTRDMIGKEYELSGSSVGRLLKLNDLIKPFKDMVDRRLRVS